MIFNSLYQAKKKISAGSFGTVYLGENIQTSEQVAIKVGEKQRTFSQFFIIKKNEDDILSVLREATINYLFF